MARFSLQGREATQTLLTLVLVFTPTCHYTPGNQIALCPSHTRTHTHIYITHTHTHIYTHTHTHTHTHTPNCTHTSVYVTYACLPMFLGHLFVCVCMCVRACVCVCVCVCVFIGLGKGIGCLRISDQFHTGSSPTPTIMTFSVIMKGSN